MIRYYVTFSHAGGTGWLCLDRPGQILTMKDILAVKATIELEGGEDVVVLDWREIEKPGAQS